ncbi:MAG: hypothetical protein ACK4GO_15250 [Gemmobacter sp.]
MRTVALTPAQKAILDLAAARGEVALAGKKEHFACIRYQTNSPWLRIDGDPLTQEEEVSHLTDAEVLRAIFWRARERLELYGPDDGSTSWEDVLAWLQGSHI